MKKFLLLPTLAAHLAFPALTAFAVTPTHNPPPPADEDARIESIDSPREPLRPLEIVFSEPATMILEPNGDIVVEFDPICELGRSGQDEPLQCTFPVRYIRYVTGSDRTDGYGVLFGAADDGSVWTIDLAQIDWPGAAAIMTGNLSPLLAAEIGGSERVGMTSFSW